MRRALRYIASLCVGLIIAVSVGVSATADRLIVISLFPLYGTVSSMLIAHRQAFSSLNRDAAPARKRSAIAGSVAAFTSVLLLEASIPAGTAGIGLMLLGVATTVADVDDM